MKCFLCIDFSLHLQACWGGGRGGACIVAFAIAALQANRRNLLFLLYFGYVGGGAPSSSRDSESAHSLPSALFAPDLVGSFLVLPWGR